MHLDSMIRVENLHKRFGGVHAVNDASLHIKKGSITGLIGPNGAGKTTLFNVIAGHYKPTSGRILLDGEDITGLQPHELFQKGVLRTFQLAHEFSSLTVRENLMMVPSDQAGESLLNVWFRKDRVYFYWEQHSPIIIDGLRQRLFSKYRRRAKRSSRICVRRFKC